MQIKTLNSLTNTTFLGCGFKSLGLCVLSPMGAAQTDRTIVNGFGEICYLYMYVCIHSKNQSCWL